MKRRNTRAPIAKSARVIASRRVVTDAFLAAQKEHADIYEVDDRHGGAPGKIVRSFMALTSCNLRRARFARNRSTTYR
jgi:hypothetical protein